MSKEFFVPIKGYEGHYEVSNLGKIKSLERMVNNGTVIYKRKEKLLRIAKFKTGYRYINLCKNGVATKFLLHRIVAIAFLPNPDNLPEVNHKFGDKSDNTANSLEWCSASQNVTHALRSGLKEGVGSTNIKAKLTENQVLLIRKLFEENPKLNPRIVAIEFGVKTSAIYKIVKRESWRHI